MRWLLCMIVVVSALAGNKQLRAQATDVLLFESFDDVVAPELPGGWSGTPSAWETSTAAASPSGGNNVMSRGSIAGELRTPPLNLSDVSSATIRFVARRTSSFDMLNLTLTASVDGGSTFDVVIIAPGDALPEATSTYQQISAVLPSTLLGREEVLLRFEALGNSSSTANSRLDDVQVTAERPVSISPVQLSFTAAPGQTATSTFVATNFSGDLLELSAPTVTSGPFSVQPSGEVVLSDGSAQEYVVSFAPIADGDYGATLSIVHAHGTGVVQLTGTTMGGRLGFLAPSSVATEGAAVDVVLSLDFTNVFGLHGVQFEAVWDDPALLLEGISRGTSIGDAGAWTLSHESAGQSVRSVLLANGLQNLAPGRYDSLLILQFLLPDEDEASGDSVQLTLTNVIGALAVPEGRDANLTANPARHTVYIGEREAFLVPEPTELVLPDVQVGDSVSGVLSVANPGGNAPLVIQSVASTNALVRVSPDSATVEPDSAFLFTVTFTPSFEHFGVQHAVLRFVHTSTSGGADSVSVTARGVGGRGDADADGHVDAVDVVQVLDFVLERGTPEDGQLVSSDVFPFPQGDGLLDVRDLTVLTHAVVQAAWPDGIPLPAAPVMGNSTAPFLVVEEQKSGGSGEIHFGERWNLAVRTDVAVRALQVVLATTDVSSIKARDAGSVEDPPVILFHYDESHIRVICYRSDGQALPPGQVSLLEIEPKDGGGKVRPLYVTGVDEGMRRVPVTIVEPGSEGDDNEGPGSAPGLGLAYPNPIRFAAGERLRLPLVGRTGGGRGRASVYNILGQRVRRLKMVADGDTVLEWDGRDQHGGLVSPGIYFVRLDAGDSTTRAVVATP